MTDSSKSKLLSSIKTIYELHKATHIKWESLDVAVYIADYADEHPEKKITSHLRRKLKREYYRSLKEEKVRKEKE